MRVWRVTVVAFLVVALLADSLEAAKKKHRTRDRDDSQARTLDDSELHAKKDEPGHALKKEHGRKEKAEKEEKPLKKAEEESSSSSEEEDKKGEESNKTIVIPPNGRKRSVDRREAQLSTKKHTKRAEVTLSRTQELNDGLKKELVFEEAARPEYRKHSHQEEKKDMKRAKRTLDDGRRKKEGHVRRHHRSEHTDVVHSAGELKHKHDSPSKQKAHADKHLRRDHSSSASTEQMLTKARELNDGEKRPVDQLPSQSQMPNRFRRTKGSEVHQTLTKTSELNDGAQKPVDNKPSQSTMPNRFRRTKGSEGHQTLTKTSELNDGVQKPVDNKPSQSTMDKRRRRSHHAQNHRDDVVPARKLTKRHMRRNDPVPVSRNLVY